MIIKIFRNIDNLDIDFSSNSIESELDLKRGNFIKVEKEKLFNK